MQKFTEAYTKARDVISKQEFEGEWQKYLTDCKARTLFGDKGFVRAASKSPDLVRAKITEMAKAGKCTTGEVIFQAASKGKPSTTAKERAATLKMIRHVYRVKEKGSQNVWVYAAPKGHTGWIYDEISGDDLTVKSKLSKDEEIFTAEETAWMSSSLAVALKVCEDTRVKLSAASMSGTVGAFVGKLFGSERTREMVKHWFLDDACGEKELAEAITKLSAGFKKIAVACNSPTLVFADYPDWRAQRDKYFGGAFRGGEGGGFPVIYLEGAFTRLTGNSGKQWLCAETIIHELSHHEVSTQDHRYDSHGLKPDKTTFPFAKTIENADSWGYFALDLAGYLSKTDHDKTWK